MSIHNFLSMARLLCDKINSLPAQKILINMLYVSKKIKLILFSFDFNFHVERIDGSTLLSLDLNDFVDIGVSKFHTKTIIKSLKQNDDDEEKEKEKEKEEKKTPPSLVDDEENNVIVVDNGSGVCDFNILVSFNLFYLCLR